MRRRTTFAAAAGVAQDDQQRRRTSVQALAGKRFTNSPRYRRGLETSAARGRRL
jgi:hypothetical protein